MPILEMEGVTYAYRNNKPLLNNVNLRLAPGELVAILGPSGSGKTTLLSLLGGLDVPNEGRILYDGQDIAGRLAAHRRHHVAFIFQAYNLIDYLTPLENVALARRREAASLLGRLGLSREEMHRSVLQLSGGQQQRVAIARALASAAPVLLADEPTGNLDADTAQSITDVLLESAHTMNRAVVVVTHSQALARQADAVWRLRRGALVRA